MGRRVWWSVLAAGVMALPAVAEDASDVPGPPDLMTFASGVLPVSVSTGDADLRTGMEQAMAMIDGNAGRFSLTPRPSAEGDVIELVYGMPALTRFAQFAVPRIRETPSPSQTFAARIEIAGSVEGPEGPFVPLASAVLEAHETDDEVTVLDMQPDPPEVLWVRVRMSDGISVERDATFLEFSELIGTGTRRALPVVEGFTGTWRGRGVRIELAQTGSTVRGCYDTDGTLQGTVDGVVLRATGATAAGIPSQFVLIAGPEGALRGVRSANGAPFRLYEGEPSDASLECFGPEAPDVPEIGCGSTLHGIGFDFDSAAIRPASRPLLEALHAGLSAQDAGAIQIVGHSSSEGAAAYNRDLSQRRAQSVADALVALGLDPARVTAAGMGEDKPIASNDDEAGRSLNRRVEILCSG